MLYQLAKFQYQRFLLLKYITIEVRSILDIGSIGPFFGGNIFWKKGILFGCYLQVDVIFNYF